MYRLHDCIIDCTIASASRPVEAEDAARMSLEARTYHFGAESLPVAASLHSLSAVLLRTGRLSDAEAQCRRCLQIRLCGPVLHVSSSGPLFRLFKSQTHALPKWKR